MRLDKKDKDTIRKILNGEVYNVLSFVKSNQLGHTVTYDKGEVEKLFCDDPIEKIYYRNKKLLNYRINTLCESEYQEKVRRREIDPDYYIQEELTVFYRHSNYETNWEGKSYFFNFYQGVYIANSINDIIDFLTLCQYLKSEMLIYEANSELCPEELGLFFEKGNVIGECQAIDYNTLEVDDSYYISKITGALYYFSEENCRICSDSLGKRIYPSQKLRLFVSHNFKTSEQLAHKSTLMTAWIAIAVSITVSIIPSIISNNSKNKELEAVSLNIQEIKEEIIRLSEVIQKDSKTRDLLDVLNSIRQEIEKISSSFSMLPIKDSGDE